MRTIAAKRVATFEEMAAALLCAEKRGGQEKYPQRDYSELVEDFAFRHKVRRTAANSAPDHFAQAVMARVRSPEVSSPRHVAPSPVNTDAEDQRIVGALVVSLVGLVAALGAVALFNVGIVLGVVALAVSIIFMVANAVHPVVRAAGEAMNSPAGILALMTTPLVMALAFIFAATRLARMGLPRGLRDAKVR